jgi:hypothetical protein
MTFFLAETKWEKLIKRLEKLKFYEVLGEVLKMRWLAILKTLIL